MHTPSTVPYGADQTVYLVVDRFGGLGSIRHETEVERPDIEGIIAELLAGQFNDPSASLPSIPSSTGPKTSPQTSPTKFRSAAISKAKVCPITFRSSWKATGRASAIHRGP
jgi:hypothetical protein